MVEVLFDGVCEEDFVRKRDVWNGGWWWVCSVQKNMQESEEGILLTRPRTWIWLLRKRGGVWSMWRVQECVVK